MRSDPENGTISRMPIARMGTPDEVAWAALYLASPLSAWVTGSQLVVDGGLLAGLPRSQPHGRPAKADESADSPQNAGPLPVLSSTERANQ